MRGSDSNIPVTKVRTNNLQAGWLVLWHAENITLSAAVTNPKNTLNAVAFKNAGATVLIAGAGAYLAQSVGPGQILMNTHGASRVEFMLGGATADETASIQAFGYDDVPMTELQNTSADLALAATSGFPWRTNSDGQGQHTALGLPYSLEVAAESMLTHMTDAQREAYAALDTPSVDVVNSASTGYFTRRGPLYRTPFLLNDANASYSDLVAMTFTRPVRFDCRGASMVIGTVFSATAATNWVLLGRFV